MDRDATARAADEDGATDAAAPGIGTGDVHSVRELAAMNADEDVAVAGRAGTDEDANAGTSGEDIDSLVRHIRCPSRLNAPNETNVDLRSDGANFEPIIETCVLVLSNKTLRDVSKTNKDNKR